MKRKRNILIVITVLLVISIGNYFRISPAATVRTVDFVSIFIIGVLAGLLLSQFLPVEKKHNLN